ncbi:MAG TPA: S8 family serine peptidase, partial [Oscillatoriaceae cyanobacterium]
LLVKLRPGATLPKLAGITPLRNVPHIGWQVVGVRGALAPAIAQLRALPSVLAVEPQQLEHLGKTASRRMLGAAPPAPEPHRFDDPDLAKNDRNFDRLEMEKAWAITTGAPSQVVAILDTGIDPNHPDLKDHLVPGYNFVANTPNPRDDFSHGTACAGVVAATANNGVGSCGIAPGVRIMPVKVLDHLGNGPLETAARGLVWAADHGATIASMSFGQDQPSQALDDAIAYARAKNVVVIAAMGNDGEEVVKHWPADSAGVLAVGATYDDDTPALFTTAGDWVGVAAPGTQIWTTMPTYQVPPSVVQDDFHENYYYFSGTSAAAPVVAGVAALIRTKFPQLNEAQVRDRLEKTADDVGAKGFDNLTGHGRVNAYRALTDAL